MAQSIDVESVLNPTEANLDVNSVSQEAEYAWYDGHRSDPPPSSEDPSDSSDEMQSDVPSDDDELTPRASCVALPATAVDGTHPLHSTQNASQVQQNHGSIAPLIIPSMCDDTQGVGSSTGVGPEIHNQHPNASQDHTDGTSTIEEGYVFEGNLIPLLEYPHATLMTRDIREHMAIIAEDTERVWENTQPPMIEATPALDPQYIVEPFRTFSIPDLLIALPPRKPSTFWKRTPKTHTAAIYLTIVTYMHLLGLRAVAFFQSGIWDIPTRSHSTCRLSNFVLLFTSTQHPHNQVAKQIFITNFIRSAHEGLYSLAAIGGNLLHEETVGRAFDHAFNTQAEIQKRHTTDRDPTRVYKEERSIAIKIGKWLMLHQAFWIDGNRALGALVGTVGPGLCSSDESDDELDGVQGQRVSKRVPWRSAKFRGFIESLRRAVYILQHRPSPTSQAE